MNESFFIEQLNKWDIEINQTQLEQFSKYFKYLVEKNKVINLTGIVDEEGVYIKHFLDSLSVTRFIDFTHVKSLVDIGTGAGFPGVPLKIIYPHIEVCLLDSVKKRIIFLSELINILDLTGINTVHNRAEELAHQGSYREFFDIATSRAVGKLDFLSEYALPFVKNGGKFIAFKGRDIEGELTQSKKAISILGGGKVNVYNLELPNDMGSRNIVCINKLKETPRIYPRRPGIPSSKPL